MSFNRQIRRLGLYLGTAGRCESKVGRLWVACRGLLGRSCGFSLKPRAGTSPSSKNRRRSVSGPYVETPVPAHRGWRKNRPVGMGYLASRCAGSTHPTPASPRKTLRITCCNGKPDPRPLANPCVCRIQVLFFRFRCSANTGIANGGLP